MANKSNSPSNRRKLNAGERYGMLTVIEVHSYENDGRCRYLCRCDCGNETIVTANKLKSGNTKSCGCLRYSALLEANITHGLSKTKLYRVWASMKDRCYRKKSSRYNSYGGRGIKICDEWKNDFSTFYKWAMANGYQEGLSIDRINVNGNYEPSNCRWVTIKEQSRNKQNSITLTKNGEVHSAIEWASILGINVATIYSRKQLGMSDERCLYVGSLKNASTRKMCSR